LTALRAYASTLAKTGAAFRKYAQQEGKRLTGLSFSRDDVLFFSTFS
jgi:hypothetical protein